VNSNGFMANKNLRIMEKSLWPKNQRLTLTKISEIMSIQSFHIFQGSQLLWSKICNDIKLLLTGLSLLLKKGSDVSFLTTQ
jgi:hypothetical protein